LAFVHNEVFDLWAPIDYLVVFFELEQIFKHHKLAFTVVGDVLASLGVVRGVKTHRDVSGQN
jgi:hypothetical protein